MTEAQITPLTVTVSRGYHNPMFLVVFLLMGALCIWVAVLTFFFWSLSAHYNNLVKSTNKKTLQTVLDSLVEELSVAKKDIVNLSKVCDTIIAQGRLHIQKVGLLRFNPFKETGGDQSFILSFLDEDNNGIVLSGLYSRTGMRWYAKKIKKGQGLEHGLSEEEKEAIRQAVVIK